MVTPTPSVLAFEVAVTPVGIAGVPLELLTHSFGHDVALSHVSQKLLLLHEPEGPPVHPLSHCDGAPSDTPVREIDAPLGLPSWQST
jgi:hypothetical protein